MIFRFLAALISLYSILIIIRFILSWFGNTVRGKFFDFLRSATDPYLDWWARNLPLRVGVIDFSPILGLTVLSILQNILSSIGRHEVITIGIILAIILMAVWNVASFIIGFYIIVIILRLIAYLANINIFHPFWQVIESISQPVLYRVNKLFFKNDAKSFVTGIIITITALIIVRIVLGIFIPMLAMIFIKLPI